MFQASEFADAYDDQRVIRGAILTTPLCALKLRTPIVVEASATIVSAVNLMNENRTGCVLVQNEGKLVGVFTERDVLTKVIFRDGNRSMKVESVMTKNPETLQATATIAFALNKMSVGGYRHIPIVDEMGKPTGVVSVRDMVDFLVDLFPNGVYNLPPNYDHLALHTTDGG